MLFAKWQHHLRFCSGFPYAPLKAMVTKISKWSRIQNSFRIIPKIESLVVYTIPDITSKFQKDPSIIFWVILHTHRQTDRQTKSGKNITSLAEVIMYWGSVMCYKHTIYITIVVGLRQLKNSTLFPQLIFPRFKHWPKWLHFLHWTSLAAHWAAVGMEFLTEIPLGMDMSMKTEIQFLWQP